jgi:glycosyltransferase involved in cell wall biosynthesis
LQDPTVSFVVPCYKLAHLLKECVESILAQSYTNFEILIMDDSSPDKTAEVSSTFKDSRVKYIANEHNLGPLRNYNKGIALSRGKYVWLISADDLLRRPYVLERYVELMEAHPQIGYTFCPGVAIRDGEEGRIWKGSEYGKHNRIIKGQTFLKTLLRGNQILAPSAMARRECYERVSMFPVDVTWAGQAIDLVWGGDWYLWCVFCLFYDVGYFAEPMVNYREHELSMTNVITQVNGSEDCAAAEIGTAYMVRQKALDTGQSRAARECLEGIARLYTGHCVSREYEWLGNSATSCISIDKAKNWLSLASEDAEERRWVLARVLTGLGDEALFREDVISARRFYLRSLRQDPTVAKTCAKLAFLALGKLGYRLRRGIRRRRDGADKHKSLMEAQLTR